VERRLSGARADRFSVPLEQLLGAGVACIPS
jgi:hypothetical protein